MPLRGCEVPRGPSGGGRPRLLAVGFYTPATGLARVMRGILERLADYYEVHLIGLGYKGPVVAGRMTIRPCNLRGGDVFGVYQARDFIERSQPELVLLLNDLWILEKYLRVLAPYGERSRIVCYCPLDGRIVDDGLVSPLEPAGCLVAYTDFARRELLQAGERLARSRADFALSRVEVIPHGVDTRAFYPLSRPAEGQTGDGARLAAKRRLFPGEPGLEDSFIVLNANRLQPRKRIDLTLQGFALFAKDKPPGVRLVLHHAIASAQERDKVLRQAEGLGIAGRVMVSPAGARPMDDEELNLLYNACDVGINTAMGEGWGLVSFEHAATGAAQIVPRHSACAELWSGAAELLETAEPRVPRFSLLEMQSVEPAGVAAALERLYADAEYRGRMALAAYRNATQPAYRWDRIAGRWRRLLDGLLEGSGALASPAQSRLCGQ